MALALLLDANGDLDFNGGGPRLVRGLEAARGALIYRFGTQAGTGPEDPGEWAYNYAYGVRWRQQVFGRYFSLDETQAHLADVATQTTGVQQTAAYQVQLTVDSNTRTQFFAINELRLDDGTVAVDAVLIPLT